MNSYVYVTHNIAFHGGRDGRYGSICCIDNAYKNANSDCSSKVIFFYLIPIPYLPFPLRLAITLTRTHIQGKNQIGVAC